MTPSALSLSAEPSALSGEIKKAVRKCMVLRGTGGSNPACSTGESGELPITSEGSAGSAGTGTDRRKPLQLWRGSQKVADETCYCCRILDVRRMTGARDDMDPRAGEALRELVRVY